MTRQYHESKTADGAIVSYQVDPDKVGDAQIAEITAAFAKIEQLDTRETKASVSHGGCGMYTRYDIAQYDYAGGNDDGCGGYIEVLHIKDAPDGRAEFVLHEYGYPCKGHIWSEWKTLEDARKARKSSLEQRDEKFAKLPGFIRFVGAGSLCPWFYAVGEEIVIRDFAVGRGMEDDPAFRIGTRWVTDQFGYPEIKTCMGCRFIDEMERDSHTGGQVRKRYRVVYWNDGSSTDVDDSRGRESFPRPLCDDELWIEEAMRQFRKILGGKKTSISIPFSDGARFVGKYIPKKKVQDAAGRYFVNVTFADGTKGTGDLSFAPTEECPTVVAYTKKRIKDKKGNKPVARITVESQELTAGQKKWKGCFYERAAEEPIEAKEK